MSRYTPFYLGVFIGASFAVGAHVTSRCATSSAPPTQARVHVAPVGFSAPAQAPPPSSRRCTQLASAYDRWLDADARAKNLQSKSQGALALAILSDHDDATHFARAKRFQEDAHRAERSASLALRALSTLRERDDDQPNRCVF